MPSFRPPTSPLARYGPVPLVVGLAVLLRWPFGSVLGGESAYLFLWPAVAACAVWGGIGPGLLATTLSAAAALAGGGNPVGLAVFAALGAGVSLIGDLLRRSDSHVRADQERWRITLAGIADAVITTDPLGRVGYLNPAAEALTGWPAAEAVGRPLGEVFRVVSEETGKTAESPVLSVLATGRTARPTSHTVLVARDGTRRSIERAAGPVREDGDEIVGAVVVFRDVTARRRTDRALAESEARFRRLVEGSVFGVVIARHDGRLVYANDAFLRTVGRARADLDAGALRWDTLTPAEHLLRDREALAELTTRGAYEPYEKELVRADGRRVPVLIGAVAADPSPDGEPVGVAYCVDLTEQKLAEAQLRDRVEEVQTLMDVLPVPLVIAHDPECRQLTGNRAAHDLLRLPTGDQLTRTALTGRRTGDFTVRIAGRPVREDELPLHRAAATAEPVRGVELELAFDDGSARTVFAYAAPLFDPNGQVRGCVGAFVDLTDQRRLAAAVRERERFLRTVLDTAPGLISVKAADGRLLLVNRQFAELVGRPAGEIVGKTDREVFAGRDVEALVANDRRVLAGAGPVQLEEQFDHPDGPHTYLSVKTPAEGVGFPGRVLVGFTFDITDRKRAEEALRATTRRLVDVLESVADAFTAVDRDWRVTYANGRALRLTRQTADDVLGRNVWEAFPMFRGTDVQARMERVMADREETHFEYAGPLSGRWYEAGIYPTADGGVSIFSRDVHDRKQLEADLRRHADRLAEADRRKDEFLAMLGHELRNPLAAIRNAAHLLTADPSRVGWAAGMLTRQTDHLTRMVDDLLDVSRIAGGKVRLRLEPVELAAVLHRAVETARGLIEGRRHDLDVVLPRGAVWLDADPVRLAQVFANLLTNAAKYTDPGGRITVTAQKVGDQVAVAVTDTGIGIPADVLPWVFDLFTQADRSLDRSQGGLGIGLSLVQGLVEMHGGTVEAMSDGPGKGSTFTVRLPLRPAGTDTGVNGAVPAADAARPRRVLIVDDNADAAGTLAMILEVQGHEVRTAGDGPAALIEAAAFRPEVVLLDIGLPGMDGYEVARRMRAMPELGGATLAALTGYSRDEDRQRATEAGFDRHLVKPADPREVQKLLNPS